MPKVSVSKAARKALYEKTARRLDELRNDNRLVDLKKRHAEALDAFERAKDALSKVSDECVEANDRTRSELEKVRQELDGTFDASQKKVRESVGVERHGMSEIPYYHSGLPFTDSRMPLREDKVQYFMPVSEERLDDTCKTYEAFARKLADA
jgi:hypothetical protein